MHFQDKNQIHRLHIETNCGRYRSWKCIQCSPAFLTEDAYAAHMESEHKFTFKTEDELVVPEVEVLLTEEANSVPIVNFADPLHLMLENDKPFILDAENSRIIVMDERKHDMGECLAEESVNEK